MGKYLMQAVLSLYSVHEEMAKRAEEKPHAWWKVLNTLDKLTIDKSDVQTPADVIFGSAHKSGKTGKKKEKDKMLKSGMQNAVIVYEWKHDRATVHYVLCTKLTQYHQGTWKVRRHWPRHWWSWK